MGDIQQYLYECLIAGLDSFFNQLVAMKKTNMVELFFYTEF